jgi:small subunit ribosomal protein S6
MTTREYEAMFLLDNAQASEDFEGTAAQVDKILEKHGAEIVQKEKWDERKLAYEIKGHRRATYYLVYFRAATSAIEEINSDVQLNEVILRHMVIVLDVPIEEHIKVFEDEKERLAEDSRKSSLSGWGDRKKPGGPGGGRREERFGDEAKRDDVKRDDVKRDDVKRDDGESGQGDASPAKPAEQSAGVSE